MTNLARRALAGSTLGLLMLAGCAADLPETPPPADALPGPGLGAAANNGVFELQPGGGGGESHGDSFQWC